MKSIVKILIVVIMFGSSACTHEVTPGQIAAGPKKIDKNAVIAGTVKLKEGLKPNGFGTLFIIARNAKVKGGPPLAVKRVEDPVFPIGFQMSQKNVMIKSNQFTGDITLSAKWSKSGSPMKTTSGDLFMTKPLLTKVGTKGLEVILDGEQ